MASAFKRSFEPDAHDLEREIFRNHSLSEGKNIGVVVLTRKPGDFLIPAKRATNPAHFVRRHRFAIARSAEDNAAIAFASRDCLRGRTNENRIIDRLFAERPEIFHLVPELAEQCLHLFFVTKTGVIGAEAKFSSHDFVR